jgi:hypothetical protein
MPRHSIFIMLKLAILSEVYLVHCQNLELGNIEIFAADRGNLWKQKYILFWGEVGRSHLVYSMKIGSTKADSAKIPAIFMASR